MHRRLLACIPLAALASALPAMASGARAGAATLDAGGGLAGLDVQVTASPPSLVVRRCEAGACGSPETTPIPPGKYLFDDAHVKVEPIAIGDRKRVLGVRVAASDGTAWEALVAGVKDRSPIVWSGPTGYVQGGEGERSGVAIQRFPSANGVSIVVGDVREDVRLCGEPATLLSPKALDPKTMELRPASVQRLPVARREAAISLDATPKGAPAPPAIGSLLAPTYASTATGTPNDATDGDLKTRWAEAKPGIGAGEFLLFHAPSEVPIEALAFTPLGVPVPKGAGAIAPSSFYVVTDGALFDVSLPDPVAPGEAYVVRLPTPVTTSCLAVVLDEAEGDAKSEVGFAEIAAYGPFDAGGITAAVKGLAGGGPRALVAAAELKRGGDAAAHAVAEAYDTLDPTGQALAIDVAIGAGSCASAAPLFVKALGGKDAEASRKAGEKLVRCGKGAIPALLAGLDDDARAADVAPLLSILDPRAAIGPLAAKLGEGTGPRRRALRAAIAHAAPRVNPETLTTLLERPVTGASADRGIELLRALSANLTPIAGAASKRLMELAKGADAGGRYRLTGPLVALARAGDAAAIALAVRWLSSDTTWMVRGEIARAAAAIPGLASHLDAAFGDASPRVREAALLSVADARLAGSGASAARLAVSDEWTFVREAALGAIHELPPSREGAGAIARGLKDSSPRVRVAALEALPPNGYAPFAERVRSMLTDPAEGPRVRAAAARAIGLACDKGPLSDLTELARRTAFPIGEADTTIGLAATFALGKLHPSDLAGRLAPLAGSPSADVKDAARSALTDPGRCR